MHLDTFLLSHILGCTWLNANGLTRYLRTQCQSSLHEVKTLEMIKSHIITRISHFSSPKMSAINQSWDRCKNLWKIQNAKIFLRQHKQKKFKLIGLSQKVKISFFEISPIKLHEILMTRNHARAIPGAVQLTARTELSWEFK